MNLNTYCIKLLLLIMCLSFYTPSHADSGQTAQNKKVAISLAYDDALNTQLDHAIPALNKYNMRASFYLTLSSPTIKLRLPEWRKAASLGHELANHTIYHPCMRSKPGREWVTSYKNLDAYPMNKIVEEVTLANTILHMIDGKTARTYTPPCLDLEASGKSYIQSVEELFVAIKGQESTHGLKADWLFPNGQTGQALIDYVKTQARSKDIINITFHGVGGEHIAVSKDAHDALLQYLDSNRDIYWVDSYVNIMQCFLANKAETANKQSC